MSNANNEAGEAPKAALDGLNDSDRKETEEIIKSIEDDAGDGTKKDDAQKSDEEKKAEADKKAEDDSKAKDEADKKAADDAKKKEEDDKAGRRDTKLVPAWQKEVAEKQAAAREKELLAQIDELKKNPPKDSSTTEAKKDDAGKVDETKNALDEEIREAAKGLDLDEAGLQKLVDAISKKVGANATTLPDDVKAILEGSKKVIDERETEREEMLFKADFEKDVLPLIKKEYGDDVAASVVDDIREKLKGIAYTPEYAKISYNEIYLGKGNFRELVAPKRMSAESSKGGHTAIAGQSIKFEDLNEEQVKSLSDEDFEKYSDYMAKAERRT